MIQKPDKVLAGCTKLQAEHPGRRFTTRQIAAACGVSHMQITKIEHCALKKVARALLERHPEIVRNVIGRDRIPAFLFALDTGATISELRESIKT